MRDTQDARAGSREQDKQPDVQEDGDNSPAQLCDELVLRLRAQEVPRLQVARHVRRLCGRARRDDARREVDGLGGGDREACALADTTEDELRRLRDCRDGVHVRRAGRLHADEGEREAENEREKRLADVHMEECREDCAAHDYAREEAGGPPKRWHAVFFGR